MSDGNGLNELAVMAKALTPERRKELDARLSLDGSPRIDLGVVRCLAASARAMEAESPDAARELRELAAVGAARVLSEQRSLAGVLREWDSPETRANLTEEDELIRAGKMELLPLDDLIREMEGRIRSEREGA